MLTVYFSHSGNTRECANLIVPFITHAGTGLGLSAEESAELCPGATVLKGLAVWGAEVKTAQTRVSEWLQKLGMY